MVIAFGTICMCEYFLCYVSTDTCSCYHFSLPQPPPPLPSIPLLQFPALYIAADLCDLGYAAMMREGQLFVLVPPVRISFHTGSF